MRLLHLLFAFVVAPWLAPSVALAQAAAPFTGLPGTTIRFAEPAEGRRVLGGDDEWVQATSDFQRGAVTGRTPPVSAEDFRAQQAAAVLPWTPAQVERWRRALEALAPAWKAWPVPLPAEVLLVNTDGSDAAHAPYTRGAAVVLPSATLTLPGYSDVELMAHELFHVASRHRPAWASRLYGAIGFEPAPALRWPAEWQAIRIANPDAPHDRHQLRTRIGDRPVALMPVIVAGRTTLKPGETFFDVLDLRLLEVEPDGAGGSRAVRAAGGEPAWHAPQRAGDFLVRLGGNTGYVMHPEETMADNVAFLMSGRAVRNPALIERVGALLRESARQVAR